MFSIKHINQIKIKFGNTCVWADLVENESLCVVLCGWQQADHQGKVLCIVQLKGFLLMLLNESEEKTKASMGCQYSVHAYSVMSNSIWPCER